MPDTAAEDDESGLLRPCVLSPACPASLNIAKYMSGKLLRSGWVVFSGYSAALLLACPDHAWILAEDSHRPSQRYGGGQGATTAYTECACGHVTAEARTLGGMRDLYVEHLRVVLATQSAPAPTT